MRHGGSRATALLVLATVAVACSPGEPLAPPSPTTAVSAVAEAAAGADAEAAAGADVPGGTVTVAYPDVPATWSGADASDTAAIDLAALWGLPLYRYDPDGQLVPALAMDASFPEVADGWAVDVTLAAGAWSDGSAVTAADAVATVEALRGLRVEEWSTLTAVEALDERHLRLTFDEPLGRWAHLLTGPPGVLPAKVLADRGLDAFADALPVVGGWFELAEHDEGRSATFTAHTDGPLGAPALERLEVLFVPSYETALGLLQAGAVDVVLGHLALNPEERARRLDGVRAAAPLGGTSVALEWLPSGTLGDDASVRRRAFAALDLSELVAGLLGGVGAPATSPVPGLDGPLDDVLSGGPTEPVEREVVVLVHRSHEALGFTSRAVQRDLTSAGAVARLVAAATPELLDPVDPHDGALRIRRSSPRPSLGAEGDRVPPGPDDALVQELGPTFATVAEEAWELPLYRIGVAHAWDEDVDGPEPSSWPGLGLWNVGEWRVGGAS